jgi:hypothetical protein
MPDPPGNVHQSLNDASSPKSALKRTNGQPEGSAVTGKAAEDERRSGNDDPGELRAIRAFSGSEGIGSSPTVSYPEASRVERFDLEGESLKGSGGTSRATGSGGC